MRIQHNIPAMNAYRNYSNNTSALSKNLEKLSSGYKINRAGDDAAGLAISEKMRAQITGLSAAQKNVKDGISLVKTAEGAMQEIHDMLNRMDYLATQSANGTYDNEVDRLNLQKEVDSLKAEIDRIADSANFNGIKLLDGSLGEKVTNTMSIPTEAINMTDGVTINSPVDGAGQNAAMKITFNGDEAKFGAGDSIAFDLTDTDGNVTTKTFAFGSDFTGADFSAQMTSLANAINADSDVSAEYTASVVKEKVTGEDGVEIDKVVGIEIKANAMTIPNNTIGNVVATDKQLTASATTSTVGANATGTATKAEQGWDDLFGVDPGATEIKPGDEITFEFEINGKAMTVTARAKDPANPDAENEFAFGDTISDTITNMVAVLNNATFDDDPDTAVDESLLKVSDYLEFKANTAADGTGSKSGSIQVVSKTTDNDKVVEATDLKINGTTAGTLTGTAGAAGTATGAVPQVSNVTVGGMAAGDSFRLSGTLRDGRTFTVDLTAGDAVGDNKFDMDDGSAAKIAAGIVAALKDAGTKVTITNPATNEDEIVTADKLFAADTSLEFQVAAGANDSIDITSSVAGAPGKGMAGSITSATALNGPKLTATATPTPAKVPSASENSLTFSTDENGKLLVEQGTTLTIDNKTYEFVDGSDPSRFLTHKDNIAVAVNGLNAGTATVEDLANALKGALGDTYTSADNKVYVVEPDGGTLTIKSQATDGTGTALEVKMGDSKPSTTLHIEGGEKKVLGDKQPTDISSIKVGDTVTINGKVYEFTSGKRTQNENAIQVDIKDITNEKGVIKASDVATKLAEAVNANDDKIIARADDKDVIFTSKYNAEAVEKEDAYAAPKVELPKTSNSLTLQIGDTADKFNQMEVKVGDMHVAAMGIDGISVAKQGDAQAAIDVIKSAINYVSGVRGDLGAVQNRLDHTANNLSVMAENIQDAESTIRDTDVAEEMMSYVKNNILVQSAQAMLAQANQLPQGVLQLLG